MNWPLIVRKLFPDLSRRGDEIEARDGIILAANEAAGAQTGEVVVVLANEEYATAEKKNWIMLAPYGEHPNQQGLQKFDRTAANQIVAHWNSLPNTGVKVLGAPWYIGHPDVKEFRDRYRDTAAYGRITDLDARQDGLFANVDWNDDGRAIIRGKKYHGHSVAWYMRPSVSGSGWTPFALRSVGFTNEPNIPVPPITAANETTTMTEQQQKDLAKKLGLPEVSTFEQILETAGRVAANEATGKTCEIELAELRKKLGDSEQKCTCAEGKVAANETEIAGLRTANATLTTNVSTLTTERDTAKTLFANERLERAKPLIEQATKDGKLTPADRAGVEKLFANEWDSGISDLTKRGAQTAMHTQSGIDPKNRLPGHGTAATKTSAMLLAVNEHIAEKAAKGVEVDYLTAFDAVRGEKPELFKA